VHPTLGILARFQAFFYASAFFQSDGVPPPAPARVTQTVGRFRNIAKFFFNRLKLTESKHEIMYQQLSPYADWSLFKAIESKFISKFSNQPVIGIAFYGFALVIANDVFRRQQVRRKLPC